MNAKIKRIGQTSVTITIDKKVIQFDPTQTDKKADLILLSGKIIPEMKPIKKKTIILTPQTFEEKSTQSQPIGHKESYEFEHITITAMPAYKINKLLTPLAIQYNGYMITDTKNKETIYIAGPTDLIPEMNLIESTAAIIPVEGNCMDLFEGLAATNVIHSQIYIPNAYADKDEDGIIACERFVKKCIYNSDLAK